MDQPANPRTCSHLPSINGVEPSGQGCEDCERLGEVWIQVLMCMDCGHRGCGDSSKNMHARAHFHATKHPIVRSVDPGEEWGWCYVDELWFERLGSS